MTTEQLDDLRERVRLLDNILRCDEPGLGIWHSMVNDAWIEVVEWRGGKALDNYFSHGRRWPR